MDSVETYREKVVTDLFKSKTFNMAWSIWEPAIKAKTKNLSDPVAVFDLGSELTNIFASTATSGRGQEVLSAAGNVWESLVTWYLNLVFSGSNGIAIKQKKTLVPECLGDCTTINYGADQTNTESDVVVIIFPDDFPWPAKTVNIKKFSDLISPRLSAFEFGIIQCKTNWNDNSQIPMLWDMVYRAKGFKGHGISIGRNGHSIYNLKEFTYSFMTAPTQKKPYKASDMAVKRVRNLTGGNYWGKPTQGGVAMCVNEIFNKNFMNAFGGTSVHASIGNAIATKAGVFGM